MILAALSLSGVASAQGNFEVTVDSTDSPVLEGDTLQVDFTVENTGDQIDSQEVSLATGGVKRDSTELTLDPGSSYSGTLEWTTADGDAGSYTAVVATADDTESTSVYVQEDAEFSVSIDSTNSPVTEGEVGEFVVSVENTGGAADVQDVDLSVDGVIRDTTELHLESGSSAQITLEWQTGEGETGDYLASVRSQDTSESREVRVEEGASFGVSIDGTNSPVVEGETVEVDTFVENTGGDADSQDIHLSVDGSVRDSRYVTLESGDSTVVSLQWSTAEDDADDYLVNLSSQDDEASSWVQLTEDGRLEVELQDVDSPGTEGDAFDFEVLAKNTGGDTVSQEVTLSIDDVKVDGETVALDPGSSATTNLTWSTEPGDAGEHEVSVVTEDDEVERYVYVDEVSSEEFDVELLETNAPVSTDETLQLEVELNNTGDQASVQQVVMYVDGNAVDSRELSLEPGSSTTELLRWEAGDTDPGSYNVTVSTENAEEVAEVNVTQSISGSPVTDADANYSATVDVSPDSPEEGDEVDVNLTLDTEMEAGGQARVVLALEGEEVAVRRLGPEDGEHVELSTTAEAGRYSVEVDGREVHGFTVEAGENVLVFPKEEMPGFTAALALTAILSLAAWRTRPG